MNHEAKAVLAAALLAATPLLAGCAAVVGAGAATGAYEYENKQQLEKLEAAFQRGDITREEYLKRKQAIEEGSVVY